MLQRLSAAVVFAFVALATPAYGQDVELAWKFAKGDKPFYQTMKTKTSQSMNIMGSPVKQDMEQEFVFSWTVKDVAEKAVVLEQKIEAVKMTITIGANKISYDSSAKGDAENPLTGFFKPLVGSAFTLTLDPATMTVTKIEGRDDFVKKLREANPQMSGLLAVLLSDDQLKQMSEPAFSVVKGKGQKVKAKDTWTKESKLAMGPIGTYTPKYTYTYSGTEKKTIDGKEVTLHKIELKTDLGYKPPDAKDASTQLPFKIESGNLETTKATGTIYFDADKGRVVDSTMEVSLKGKLTISVADQKADVDLEQTQTTTTTTSDKNPVEAPK